MASGDSPRRLLNVKFFALFVVAVLLAAVVGLLVHNVQVGRSARAMLINAQQAQEEGDMETALRCYRYCVTYDPEDNETYVAYALLLAKRAKEDRRALIEAHACLEEAVGRASDNLEVLRQAAEVTLEVRQYATAVGYWSRLAQAFPNDAAVQYNLGRSLDGAGQYKRAAAALSVAIERDPHNVPAFAELSQLFRNRLGAAARGDAILEQMVAGNGKSALAYMERARVRWQSGDMARAGTDVAAALALGKDDLEILLAAAEYGTRARRFDQVADILDRARARATVNDDRVDRALGDLHIARGDNKAAVQVFQQILDRNPDDFGVLTRLMSLQLQSSDLTAAHATLDKMRSGRFRPDYVEFFAARVLAKEKNWSAAADKLEKLRDNLRRAQFKLPELAYMVELELGNCYSGQAMYDRMLESFDRAVQTDPTSTEARFGYAVALYRTLNLPKALDQFQALYRAMGPQVFAENALRRSVLFELMMRRETGLPEEQHDWKDVEQLLWEFEHLAHADSVEIGLKRADLRLAQHRPDEALRIVFGLQKEHGGDMRVRRAVANLTATQDPEKALALLGGRDSTEDSVEMRLTRANVARRLGAARGVPLLRSLEGDIGKFSSEEQLRLWQGLGEAYLWLQDPPQTRHFWERVLALRPEDRQLRIMAFETALEAGDENWMTQAVDDFAQLAGTASAEWHYCRASYLVWQVMRRQADRQLLMTAAGLVKRAEFLRPNWSKPFQLDGKIAVMENRWDDALLEFRRAAEIAPLPLREWGQYARLLYFRGRYDEARQQALELMACDNSLSVKMLCSETELRYGNVDNSLELANATVAQSQNPVDYLWYGEFLERAGRHDEAELAFRRAAGLGAAIPEVWLALAVQLVRNKKPGEVETIMHNARIALPEDQWPIIAGQAYELLGDQERAADAYAAAAQLHPVEATIIHRVAAFFVKCNRMADARRYLCRLLAPDTKHVGDRSMLSWARRVLAASVAADAPYALQEQALALLEDNVVDGVLPPEERLLKAAILGSRPVRSQQIRAIEMIEQVQGDLGELAAPKDRMLLAHLDEKVGRWEASRDLFAGLARDYPQDPGYLAQYIGILLAHDAPESVAPLVATLEKLAPGNPETVQIRARYLAQKGDAAQAVKLLRGIVEHPVKAAQAADALAVAACLEELKFLEPAQRMYTELAAAVPQERWRLAGFLARRQRLDQALDQCQAALPAGPTVAVLATAVDALRVAGPRAATADFRRVRGWFDKVSADDAAEKSCRLQLAALLTLAGEYREAAGIYGQLLANGDLPPRQRAMVGNDLGYLLASQKQDPQHALELIDAAIEVLGPSADLRDTRGLALLAAGRDKEAVAEFRDVVAENPTGEVFFHFARALAAAGDLGAARQALRSARNAHLEADHLPPLERPQYGELAQKLGAAVARP